MSSAALAHSWYPTDCCADNDCFEIACESIVQNLKGGWTVASQWTFPRDVLRGSLDGLCHVCLPNGRPACIFLPPGT